MGGACSCKNDGGSFDIEHLKKQLGGKAFVEADGVPYQEALRQWNHLLALKKPAVIAQVSSVENMSIAVKFAKENNLPVSVCGFGTHSNNAIENGAVVVDYSAMKKMGINLNEDTLTLTGGLTNRFVDVSAGEHNRVSPFSWISHENTLELITNGGRSGWLCRKFGLLADNVTEAEVLLADGSTMSASEKDNPDLFWAIRGGSTNLGIVTKAKVKMYPVVKGMSGLLLFSFDRAKEALQHFRKVCEDEKDNHDFSAKALLGYGPDNDPIVGFLVFHAISGTEEKAVSVINKLRAFGTPTLDNVHVDTYLSLQCMFDHTSPPGHSYYVKSPLLKDLSDASIAGIVKSFVQLPPCSLKISSIIIHQLGGAIAKSHDNAVSFRDAKFELQVMAAWEPNNEKKDQATMAKWARKICSATSPDILGYLPLYHNSDDSENTYSSEVRAKLQQIKSKYDPTNTFRCNSNVAP